MQRSVALLIVTVVPAVCISAQAADPALAGEPLHLQAAGAGPAQPPAVEPTDPATRMRAWEQHQRMERESPFAGLDWRAVGPRMQGGRIESVDLPEGNTSTMYVGVGSGNLWKTINNGLTWRPIFENESSFSTEAWGPCCRVTSSTKRRFAASNSRITPAI